MKRVCVAAAALAAGWLSSGGGVAWAGEPEPAYTKAYGACMDASGGVTVEMRECISAEDARQDQGLNKAYQALMKRLPPERQDSLRKAQRLWLQFRDAECHFRGSGEEGTLGPVVIDNCYLEFTARRANGLREALRIEEDLR